jgi:hypothetical protein
MWDALTETYAVMGVPERFEYEHRPGEFLAKAAALRGIAEWFIRWL